MPPSKKLVKQSSLRQSLADFDELAPKVKSLDFDPETEDIGLDSLAAASLRRAKGGLRSLCSVGRQSLFK